MIDLKEMESAQQSAQRFNEAVAKAARVSFERGYTDGFAEGYKHGQKDAQLEIIRCKDCRYYKTYQYVNGIWKFLPKCSFNDIYVAEEDFCSQAERRKQ